MVKTLARSIREFKKPALLTPLLVTFEVILECIIPFTIANLVNDMQAGCGMGDIARYGAQLVVMAVLSLVSAWRRATPAPRRRPALRATCAGTCSTAFRTIRLRTSTNFPSPVWSRA